MKELAERILALQNASKHSRRAREEWKDFMLSLEEGDEGDIADALEDVRNWTDPAVLDEHACDEEEKDEYCEQICPICGYVVIGFINDMCHTCAMSYDHFAKHLARCIENLEGYEAEKLEDILTDEFGTFGWFVLALASGDVEDIEAAIHEVMANKESKDEQKTP